MLPECYKKTKRKSNETAEKERCHLFTSCPLTWEPLARIDKLGESSKTSAVIQFETTSALGGYYSSLTVRELLANGISRRRSVKRMLETMGSADLCCASAGKSEKKKILSLPYGVN